MGIYAQNRNYMHFAYANMQYALCVALLMSYEAKTVETCLFQSN